jgi:5-methylcytosine-specific restriction endonuclease McrA
MSLRLTKEEYKTLCRQVLDRDEWKCRVCGFRNTLNCHHIIYRSEMGVDESWNLVTLCQLHHDAVHNYKLFIGCAHGNHIGVGGGADGKLVFTC